MYVISSFSVVDHIVNVNVRQIYGHTVHSTCSDSPLHNKSLINHDLMPWSHKHYINIEWNMWETRQRDYSMSHSGVRTVNLGDNEEFTVQSVTLHCVRTHRGTEQIVRGESRVKESVLA